MKYLSEIIHQQESVGTPITLSGAPQLADGKKRIHILALGDVGATLLCGLKLLGGNELERIGIFDVDPRVLLRYEQEMNQIEYSFEYDCFPPVHILREEELFDCDVFVFCASKATPSVHEKVADVRMVQYEANKPIVEKYASMAAEKGFRGLFAVVSDPVDPLCKAALRASGLAAFQIQGFGLGVMNSRAVYYARQQEKFQTFLEEGRAFGPHGEDLVIANSILHYDEELSEELTCLTVNSNLRTREIGFKPYIAPALSSGALSILRTISGEWHYSSNYLETEGEGAFLGAKNRIFHGRTEIENLFLPENLFDKIKNAYDKLTLLG